MRAPISRVLHTPGGLIAQGVLLHIPEDSDTESLVAKSRIPSVKARESIKGRLTRALVPAQRVLALEGRPVGAPTIRVWQIPGGIV